MPLWLVVSLLGAGAVAVWALGPGGVASGLWGAPGGPATWTPEQVAAATVPDATGQPPPLSTVAAGAAAGTAIFPGVGTAIGALIGWIKSWSGPLGGEFAKRMGFPNLDALLSSLRSIGRADLADLQAELMQRLKRQEFATQADWDAAAQSWMLQVVEAYQQVGYGFST